MTDFKPPARSPYIGTVDHSQLAPNCFEGQSVLVTGRTGSFGRLFVETALAQRNALHLVTLSRDKMTRSEMAQPFNNDLRLRLVLGDIFDRQR